MPMYSFYCQWCNKTSEEMFHIKDRKQFIICPNCGGEAQRIISSAIQRVEPTWLDSAKRQLHEQDRHKIKDRNDLDKYMKREGIIQIG